MTYPVTKLISEAFYTSGIVSRQFQTVDGDQEVVGFDKLNEILTDTAIEVDLIPYFTTSYNFPVVPSQEVYFIPNLDEAETITFFIQAVRYQMTKTGRDRYFGQGRANNVTSLPFDWHTERTVGGTNLFIYFFPDQAYPMQITGLFRLQQVKLSQDLQTPITNANLGTILQGMPPQNGTLLPGQLVINGIDLAGVYANPTALITRINTGIIPFVRAIFLLPFPGQLQLQSQAGVSINVVTSGNNVGPNFLTFTEFSTQNGPLNQTFFPLNLDNYYINYLQYRLADRLCTAYNFVVPDGVTTQLTKYMQAISKESSPIDFSQTKLSTLTEHSSVNYGQVNLGRGWTV